MKAKTMSKVSKITAVAFVVVMFLSKAIFGWLVPTLDIIWVGAFIMLAFSPIDVSIWLEKFFKR